MRVFAFIVIAAVGAAPHAGAAQAGAMPPPAQQAPTTPPPASPSSATQAATPEPQAQSRPDYSYAPQGRRDPFRSLIGTGGDPAPPPRRMADGLAGMRIEELSVRGIMQTRSQLVAMVQGTDNRTYLLHEGDHVADGVVKAVVSDGLVMLQDVSDPRGEPRTREVRRLLKSYEDDQR